MKEQNNDKLSMEFHDSINRLGRYTSIIALACMLGVPFCTMIYFNVHVHIKDIFVASSSLIAMFAPMAVVENISYYPILGAGSIYLCSITGNVLNLKLPSAISGMKIAEVEPGTNEGDVISIISVAVSSIVTILILIVGMLIGKLLMPFLDSPILKPGFANITAALLGAVTVPSLLNNKKLAAVPVLLALTAFLIIGPERFPRMQSYMLIIIMTASVLAGYFLYKNNKL